MRPRSRNTARNTPRISTRRPNHGFHNDTTPRYDKAAAELAWKRTINFFRAKLG